MKNDMQRGFRTSRMTRSVAVLATLVFLSGLGFAAKDAVLAVDGVVVSVSPPDRPEYAATIERLKQMGHAFGSKASKQGDAHSVWIDPGTGRPIGVADQRINEKAVQ
jgi:gamma-glutamyltranspeptidase